MSKFRLFAASALVTMACIGVASASASAASWHVGGKALAGKAELSEIVTGAVKKSSIKLSGVTVSCTSASLGADGATNASIEAPNKGAAKSLAFEGCSVTSPAGCTIKSSTIATKELAVEIVGTEELNFKPKAGTEFATIEFNKATACGVLSAKKVKVTGETQGKVSNAATEEESHVLSIKETVGAKLKVSVGTFEEFTQETTLPGIEGATEDESWSIQ